MKKGTVIGTFCITINCNVNSDISHFALDEMVEEILEFVPDLDIDTFDIDIDTEESFVLRINYKVEGSYTAYQGDRINPPECETNYLKVVNEKELLNNLTSEYPEYLFKIDVEENPFEEEYD